MIREIVLKAVAGMGIEADYVEVEIPKVQSQGDVSTPIALGLAGVLRKAPRVIAQEIISAIRGMPQCDIAAFDSIEVAGPGFINFRFKRDYLYEQLRLLYKERQLRLRVDVGHGRRVLIEFVSANPTGPLHVGHGRGAALGNALSNLLQSAGYVVEREFYINDAGRQVRLLGQSVFAAYNTLLGNPCPFPEEGYRGELVERIAGEIASTDGKRYVGEDFDNCAGHFIDYSYRRMLDEIREALDSFGVGFDNWQSERLLFDSGMVSEGIDSLRNKGYVYDKDGAVWFKSSELGDDKDRVIIKQDGQYTYFASDLAYHVMKIERGYDELINIWGADHHGYIPRVKAVLRAEGLQESNLTVLLVQMVSLLRDGKPVQMSKRAGEFITLSDVIGEIGSDTTKFIFMTRRSDSHLEFDLEAAKKQSSENPVFYVQYAYARINSLFKKHQADMSSLFTDRVASIDLSCLVADEELQIIKKLVLYPMTFQGAVRNREPHRITFYLQELAAMFHPYYNKHRILTEDVILTEARLLLCACISIVLKEGLRILGLSAPEWM
ncbi:arginine--tRNA ligase [Candidatus Magnetobacterium casense]|uniref:Arginine--tRNA ligase n=1 Tax=Candidatus Magnetobacterium casense TaxID=1455061 RepID=A0ABS6RZ59_9BACT|nr:arginine--tRNA ligase [Candidatus Magnetobacterium casensis]MBV6341886.1 arginine--tRNA ligase [Candidatus Magnetobacterium casensis]